MSDVWTDRQCFGGFSSIARGDGVGLAGRICGACGQKLPVRGRV